MTRAYAKLLTILLVAAPAGVVMADTAPAKHKKPSELSASEQMDAAKALVTAGQNLAARLTGMLDDARREGDIKRVTCLNDTLTEVNTQVRNAQDHMAALGKATDADGRNHEFTMLGVLGSKLHVLEQKGNQCVGQDLFDSGSTKVVTEIDTALIPFEDEPGVPPSLFGYGVPDVPVAGSKKK